MKKKGDNMEAPKKRLSDYNAEDLFSLPPRELTDLLWSEYDFQIPFNEETISLSDMAMIQKMLVQTGNAYSYLNLIPCFSSLNLVYVLSSIRHFQFFVDLLFYCY